MSWSADQRTRLMAEKGILDQHFPTLQWIAPADPSRTRLEGTLRTNSGRGYVISIRVPPTFPATCPEMLVLDPAPLPGADGKPLTELSARMHTLAGINGRTKICHFQPGLWVPSNTLYLVAMKGRIWLEAYESHLRSGQPMDTFLRHMGERAAAPETPPPEETSEEGTFVRMLRLLLG